MRATVLSGGVRPWRRNRSPRSAPPEQSVAIASRSAAFCTKSACRCGGNKQNGENDDGGLVEKLRRAAWLAGGDAVGLHIDEGQRRRGNDAGVTRTTPSRSSLRTAKVSSIDPSLSGKTLRPATRAERRRLLQEAFFLQVGFCNGLRRFAIDLDLGVQLAQFVSRQALEDRSEDFLDLRVGLQHRLADDRRRRIDLLHALVVFENASARPLRSRRRCRRPWRC